MTEETASEFIRKEGIKHTMFVEHFMVALKFSVASLTGPIAVWITAMKPWVDKSAYPPMIALIGDIWPQMLISFLTGAGGFLSSGFADWNAKRKNGSGTIVPK